jgi:hypothetical protein
MEVTMIPTFASTEQAIAHGQTIVGNYKEIEALKVERNRINAEQEAIMWKDELTYSEFQRCSDLACQSQFLREAYQTALGILNTEVLK